jgi:hypothetical protein
MIAPRLSAALSRLISCVGPAALGVQRTLVNSLDGSIGTFATAETQPGSLAPTVHAAMTCYGGLKERTMAVVESVSEESRNHA